MLFEFLDWYILNKSILKIISIRKCQTLFPGTRFKSYSIFSHPF